MKASWQLEAIPETEIDWFWFACRKVIGFAITSLRDWLKKFAQIVHPVCSKTKIYRDSLAHVSSALCVSCLWLLRVWLVHCNVPLWPFWLEWLLWFCVSRFSIENRSEPIEFWFLFNFFKQIPKNFFPFFFSNGKFKSAQFRANTDANNKKQVAHNTCFFPLASEEPFRRMFF